MCAQSPVLCSDESESIVYFRVGLSLSSMEDLIEIVRQYNVIYDTKSKQYKDQSIRTTVWKEIGKKLKQPPEKCKDDWEKLRNAYTNALKRRKSKKSGQAAVYAVPWRYEEQMSFLKPFIKSRPSTANLMSPPESQEHLQPSYLSPESPVHQSPQNFQAEDRPETPHSGTSSHSQRSNRNKTSIQDLYDLMKSSHDLRLQRHYSKQQDMDETDLFFLSMSKALKSLPKLEQTKIKLDLHTAIAQAEIRKFQKQEKIMVSIDVAHQIISQPEQKFQPSVQSSTILPPTMEQTVSPLPSFDEENISSYCNDENVIIKKEF